jgi:predicted nucleic acid-binding Zn ribbon protein
MPSPPRHLFDNLEHGRGRRARPKPEASEQTSGGGRVREKRHLGRPFPCQTLAAALKQALKIPALHRRLNAVEIIAVWDDLAGEVVARHVQPMALDKGVLTLEADSSVWRQEVSLIRTELADRINARLGLKTVREIRIK